MRYCKRGTCLCMDFRAEDIKKDANLCQCEHYLREHNMETAHESRDLTEREIREAPASRIFGTGYSRYDPIPE